MHKADEKQKIDFKETFESQLKLNDLSQFNHLMQFAENLWLETLKWNKLVSLTSNLLPEDFIRENIVDALLAFQISDQSLNLSKKDLVLADFGCGGGYVTLVWSQLLVKAKFIAIDNNRKKISFIRDFSRKHHLSQILPSKSNIAQDEISASGKFDVIMTRATWKYSEFIRLAAPHLAENGYVIAFQGKWDECKSLDIGLPSSKSNLDSFKDSSNITVKTYEILPGHRKRSLVISRNSFVN